MRIKLKNYLTDLEHKENFKPKEQRREVPTITALAEEVGISRVQLQRLATSDATLALKLDLADRIITAMRKRGFPMDVNDLLEYRDATPTAA